MGNLLNARIKFDYLELVQAQIESVILAIL
jgi:hypothetical protein